MANELVVKNGLIVSGSATVLDSLVVKGNITAQQYIVSSSVTYLTESYSSGSTNWGDDLNDYHNVTGSLNVTGAIYLNGQVVGTGKLDITDFNTYTSSIKTELGAIETATGSLNSFTSSINTTIKNKMNNDGVIHNDIKSENILFNKNTPTLIDWGLSYVVDENSKKAPNAIYDLATQWHHPFSSFLFKRKLLDKYDTFLQKLKADGLELTRDTVLPFALSSYDYPIDRYFDYCHSAWQNILKNIK